MGCSVSARQWPPGPCVTQDGELEALPNIPSESPHSTSAVGEQPVAPQPETDREGAADGDRPGENPSVFSLEIQPSGHWP